MRWHWSSGFKAFVTACKRHVKYHYIQAWIYVYAQVHIAMCACGSAVSEFASPTSFFDRRSTPVACHFELAFHNRCFGHRPTPMACQTEFSLRVSYEFFDHRSTLILNSHIRIGFSVIDRRPLHAKPNSRFVSHKSVPTTGRRPLCATQ